MKHTLQALVVAVSVIGGGSPLVAQLFGTPTTAPTLPGPAYILVAPFDPGGYPDVFFLRYPQYDGTAQMMNPGLVGVSSPVITEQTNLQSDDLTQPLVAHINSAALPDVVRNEYFGPWLYLNDGAGNLVRNGALLPWGVTRWELSDLNGDGLDDIVEEPRAFTGQVRTIKVYRNLGNAVFTVAQTLSFGLTPVGMQHESLEVPLIADLNGDGFPDLVVLLPDGTGSAQVFLNDTTGTFIPGAIIPNMPAGVSHSSGNLAPSNPSRLAAGDFNGDGHRDLWASYGTTPEFGLYSAPYVVTVWPGNGDGTFGAPVTRPLTAYVTASAGGFVYQPDGGGLVRVSDLDGDGLDDVLFESPAFGPGRLAICRGSVTNLIDPPASAGGPTSNLFASVSQGAWVDIDSDGLLDYVVVAYRGGSQTASQPPGTTFVPWATYEVWGFRGLGNGVFSTSWTRFGSLGPLGNLPGQPAAGAPLAVFADFDVDGDIDVMVFHNPAGNAQGVVALAMNLSRYGSACPGYQSSQPEIDCTSLTYGNANFAIRLIDAQPNTPAILGLSVASASPAGGCGLLINLDAQDLLLPTPDGYGVTFTDATGSASFAIPLPADPGLIGFVAFAQWAVVDPLGGFSSPLGNLALSVGRTLVIGE